MIITFVPVRMDATLTLHRAGDVLTVNDTPLDFSALPEAGVLARAGLQCDWLASDVTRQQGVVRVALILPVPALPWPQPPEAAALTHPATLTLVADGPVAVPTLFATGPLP